MPVIDCRHFNGYKPCLKNACCDDSCPEKEKIQKSILIIHLGAMGSVVRTTSLLRKLKQKNVLITWLTSESCKDILEGHPAIDKLVILNTTGLLQLSSVFYDDVYIIDKSAEATAVLRWIQYNSVKGFIGNATNGSILPATNAAVELWEIGLSNKKKFFENKKTELQLIYESLELGPYLQQKYWLHLNENEKRVSANRRSEWLQTNKKTFILGINTGCSPVIQFKKLDIKVISKLISAIHSNFVNAQIVLLGGGHEDQKRNEILSSQHPEVICSSSLNGLRDGICSVNACDIVISGDSLGMHIGIALEKYIIAWFGPTCDHEIDFFEKGIAIKSNFECSPCWKRHCDKEQKCNQNIEIESFLFAIQRALKQLTLNVCIQETLIEQILL